MYQLQHYTSVAGEDLFGKWLNGLRDPQVRARVAARLIRLCEGGDKRTQLVDIKMAIKRWNEWQSRSYP